MAEKTKGVGEALQNKKESLSNENNFAHTYLNFPRLGSSADIRKHKTASKPLKPGSHSHSHLEGRQKIDSLRAIATPIKMNITSRMRQSHVIGSNCSPSPVRSPGREINNSTRLGQPAKKFIPKSDNVIFFKQLWKNIVSRYPEWVQEIWNKRQQERMAMYLQKASENETGEERQTFNDTINAEETIKYGGEEYSIFDSLDSASTTETVHSMNIGIEHSEVIPCEQRSFRSRRSFERNSSEISEACYKVIEWRDWSLQLTSDGKLIITGKSEQNMLTKSRDVSSCERVDAHTLRHRRDGIIYKLVAAADHFVCQDLPSYVRTKFQYGFPENWLEIRDMWMKYRKEGNPVNFTWSADADYNRVKPRLNKTFTGSNIADTTWYNYSSVVPPLTNEKQPIKQNVSEREKAMKNLSNTTYKRPQPKAYNLSMSPKAVNKATTQKSTNSKNETIKEAGKKLNASNNSKKQKQQHSEREAMKDLSNITYERPQHNSSSHSVSPKAVNEATTQKSTSPKNETTKAVKKLEASRKTKNEAQGLTNWYPLLSEGGLKFSGFLKSGQSNVKHTTSTIVTAVRQTKIVSCSTGNRYQLIGDLDASACTAPEIIKIKFKNGIPNRWKLIVQECIEAATKHSQQEQECAESDAGDQNIKEIPLESLAASGNLRKSKRGRIIVPPLQHWLGNPAYASQDSWTMQLGKNSTS